MIDESDLKEIWERQGGRCYWFNIPLDLNLLYKDHPDWYPKHPLAPSVDKIDETGNYTRDNLVICCRFANFGRNIYPFDKTHELISLLVAAAGETRDPTQNTRIINSTTMNTREYL
jgi:hypothetical protein